MCWGGKEYRQPLIVIPTSNHTFKQLHGSFLSAQKCERPLFKTKLFQAYPTFSIIFHGHYLIVTTQYGHVAEKGTKLSPLDITQQQPLTESIFLYRKVTGPCGQRVAHCAPSQGLFHKESSRGILEPQEMCCELQLRGSSGKNTFWLEFTVRTPDPLLSHAPHSPNYAFAVLLNGSPGGGVSRRNTEWAREGSCSSSQILRLCIFYSRPRPCHNSSQHT